MKRKAKEDKTERSETKNWDFTKITHCLIELVDSICHASRTASSQTHNLNDRY